MSALWQLLSSLWATAWLRGRLLGIGARRRFGGGRPLTAGGADYYLTAAETPVEGVDYDPNELPAALAAGLDAARAGLLDQARGASTRKPQRGGARRRRGAVAVTAALLSFAALGGGAVALVTGSTGVPAVDRLLGLYETRSEKPGAAGLPGPDGRDLQPRSRASVIQLSVGSQRLVTASYVAADGRVCSALTDPDRDDAFGAVTCVTRADLATRLSSDDGIVLGVVGLADGVVLRGFVSGRVTSLGGRGPTGPLEVQLGEAWKPDGLDGREVRPFVAVGGPDRDGLADPADYVLRSLDDDGSSTTIPPQPPS
jgi:hypothetical protein